MKKLGLFILFLLLILSGSFAVTTRYYSQEKEIQIDSSKISVVTSFYPLFFFAQHIGGELAAVTNITPAGSEPHEYDPSARQIAQIEQSKLVILNGGGLESWGPKITDNLKGKPIHIVTVGENFKMITDEHGTGTSQDPHIWLSPVLAKQQVQKISDRYIHVDPEHRTEYLKNTQELLIQLDILDQEFSAGLLNCQQRNLVTSHAAFSYLADTYGLQQIAISGISPEEEPSPARIAEIAQFVSKNEVKYIFFESLVSPKLSETIAQETGAQTLVLNPLEGLTQEEIQSGKDYFSVMRENLSALKIALACQ